MKKYLHLITALAFTICTSTAFAQTSGTGSTTQQTRKSSSTTTTTTNNNSATRTETAVGAPTRADDQMNQGNPGNPENKATSTQAGNNNASQAATKKATKTTVKTKKTKATQTRSSGTTSSIIGTPNSRGYALNIKGTTLKYQRNYPRYANNLEANHY